MELQYPEDVEMVEQQPEHQVAEQQPEPQDQEIEVRGPSNELCDVILMLRRNPQLTTQRAPSACSTLPPTIFGINLRNRLSKLPFSKRNTLQRPPTSTMSGRTTPNSLRRMRRSKVKSRPAWHSSGPHMMAGLSGWSKTRRAGRRQRSSL